MKTVSAILRFFGPRLSALAIAIFAILLTGPAFGGGMAITLTENSSTSLDAQITFTTLPGTLSVTNLGPDSWDVTFTPNSGSAPGFGSTSKFWSEGGFLENEVSPVSSNTLHVSSDLNLPNVVGQADGSSAIMGFATVTFNDSGDGVTRVPDTGSALLLFSLALLALFGASRYRALRLT